MISLFFSADKAFDKHSNLLLLFLFQERLSHVELDNLSCNNLTIFLTNYWPKNENFHGVLLPTRATPDWEINGRNKIYIPYAYPLHTLYTL